jgi:SAM-dependent methyltransferase
MIIWYLMAVFLAILIPVWLSYEYYQTKTGVAVFPTMAPMRRKIIEVLKKEVATSETRPFAVIDLGSGSGQLTWHLARQLPETRVVGVELSYVPWLRSVLRQRLFGPKNLRYVRADFFTQDLTQYDGVITYLIGRAMRPLSGKLRKELKPGALILASTFPLHDDWVPFETFDVRVPMKVKLFAYRQG